MKSRSSPGGVERLVSGCCPERACLRRGRGRLGLARGRVAVGRLGLGFGFLRGLVRFGLLDLGRQVRVQVLDAVGGRGCAELGEHAAHDRVEDLVLPPLPQLVEPLLELVEQCIVVRAGWVEARDRDVVILASHLLGTLVLVLVYPHVFVAGVGHHRELVSVEAGQRLYRSHRAVVADRDQLHAVCIKGAVVVETIEEDRTDQRNEPLDQRFLLAPAVLELAAQFLAQIHERAAQGLGQELPGRGRVLLPGRAYEHHAGVHAVMQLVEAATERTVVIHDCGFSQHLDPARGG